MFFGLVAMTLVAMPTVHEEMNQRTSEEDYEGQRAECVRGVLRKEEEKQGRQQDG